MPGDEKWKELCEQVIAERDPKRLTELVALLNLELEARESGDKAAFAKQNPSNNRVRQTISEDLGGHLP